MKSFVVRLGLASLLLFSTNCSSEDGPDSPCVDTGCPGDDAARGDAAQVVPSPRGDAAASGSGDGGGGQADGATDAAVAADASLDGGGAPVGLGRASLLRDIRTDTGSSNPSGFVQLAGKIYASAAHPLEGRALVEIRGERVDSVRSFGDAALTALTVFQDRLYFGVGRAPGAMELWRSDGTAAGSELVVADLGGPLVAVRAAGAVLYLVVDGGALDARTLWRSDGTTAGTVPLASIGATVDPPALALAGGYLFFVADSGGGVERSVWRTDGTLAGTIPLSYVYRRGKPTLAAVEGQVYFIGERETDPGVYELSIWRTDGTLPGTQRAFDAPPYPQALAASTGYLYVQGDRFGALWASRHGTEALTPLADARPETLEVSDDAAYYHAQATVVRHDAATGQRTDIYPLTSAFKTRFYPASNGLFVHVLDGTVAQLHLVSAGGSVLVRDDFPMGEARVFDGRLVMAGCSAEHGCEPWQSDGSSAGTHEIADFFYGTTDSNPREFVQVGEGPVLFAASTRLEGLEPWWTDGTRGGTRLLGDLTAGPADGFALHVGGASGVRFFRPTQGRVDSSTLRVDTDGHLVWVPTNALRSGFVHATPLRGYLLDGVGGAYAAPLSDFTGASPTFLSGRRVNDDYTDVSGPEGITTFDGMDYVAVSLAAEPAVRYVLRWGADTAPTIAAHTSANAPGIRPPLVSTDEGVYFVAAGPADQQLWRIGRGGSGAPLGTSDGPNGATVIQALAQTLSGWVYYQSLAASRDVSLCRARGASAECLAVIHDGPTLYDRQVQAAVPAPGDRLFVCNGEALWVTDGSAAGTKRLVSAANGSIDQCTALGSEVFFTADDGVHGSELWRSDGTEQGTRIEADVYPGPPGSAPAGLISAGGRLYFAAQHPEYGVEPWVLE